MEKFLRIKSMTLYQKKRKIIPVTCDLTKKIPDDYRTLGKMLCAKQAGVRLDLFLGNNYPFLTRSKWKNEIKSGHILINGRPAKRGSHQLNKDDRIHYYSPHESEPVVNTSVKLIWNEGGVSAVYKPPNLPMHEGGPYRKSTFEQNGYN